MATADTAIAAPPSGFAQVIQNFSRLTQRQRLAGAAAMAAAIALLVGVWLWSREPAYAVLFSNLEERDGGAIVTALQQQNVPYTFSAGGSAILVPSSMVHDVRLRLAAEGLPRGGLVGFELMQEQKLGVSQFHEQVNFQRALEGELSRTIQSLASVARARVHLAIPKQTAFLRAQQMPTASVLVNLHAGRNLNDAQVSGIVHLVASSVPQLAFDQVSVVDQNGQLLTRPPLRESGLDSTQLKYVEDLERSYIDRIRTILTPIVGADNFRAQVAADVDFNQTEQTAESFKPNPSPDQAIRSQQSNESRSGDLGAQGVPGALTNQPPVPATAPITTPPGGASNTATAGAQGNSNRSSVVNYELDKTIQHVRRAVGQVRRLSVAVVLNHRTTTAANGRTSTSPLSDDEVRKISDLIREAVGYSQDRGDTLNVANSPFASDEKEVIPETPWWKDPELLKQLGSELLRYGIPLIALVFVIFGVIRPLMRQVMPTPAEEREGGEHVHPEGEEEAEEAAQVTLSPEAAAAQTYEEKLARARQLAKDNPKLIANLLKEWMGATHEQR